MIIIISDYYSYSPHDAILLAIISLKGIQIQLSVCSSYLAAAKPRLSLPEQYQLDTGGRFKFIHHPFLLID